MRAFLGIAALVAGMSSIAQEVTVEHGDIWLKASSSTQPSRITTLGKDRDPELSPDGRWIVFVRGTPGDTAEGATSDPVEKTELWIVRADGTEPRLLLRGASNRNSNDVPLAYFKTPQFSPDGRTIYFLGTAAVVSGTVQAIEIATGRTREVCGGNWLKVVRRGPNAGCLVVEQHRYFQGDGSFDWTWLIRPDGTEVGPLGDRRDPAFAIRLKEVLGEQ